MLSVFRTGFYSCYLWGEVRRDSQYYLCLELAFTVAICGERGEGTPQYYPCLGLALTVAISGERDAGILSIIHV